MRRKRKNGSRARAIPGRRSREGDGQARRRGRRGEQSFVGSSGGGTEREQRDPLAGPILAELTSHHVEPVHNLQVTFNLENFVGRPGRTTPVRDFDDCSHGFLKKT